MPRVPASSSACVFCPHELAHLCSEIPSNSHACVQKYHSGEENGVREQDDTVPWVSAAIPPPKKTHTHSLKIYAVPSLRQLTCKSGGGRKESGCKKKRVHRPSIPDPTDRARAEVAKEATHLLTWLWRGPGGTVPHFLSILAELPWSVVRAVCVGAPSRQAGCPCARLLLRMQRLNPLAASSLLSLLPLGPGREARQLSRAVARTLSP